MNTWATTVREFFEKMYAGLLADQRFVELRMIDQEGKCHSEFHGELDTFLEARKNQVKGRDYYFGAHLRDSADGTRDAVSWVTTLHADLDFKTHSYAEWTKILNDLKDRKIPATVVVFTGHGLHAYWFLEKPLHLKSEVEKAHFQTVQKGLQRALGADPTHDLPRILRVPGTTNYKDAGKPIQTEILFADYERVYRPAQFAGFNPADNPPASQGPAPPVEAEIIEGGRNQALASMAGSIRRPGMTVEEIEAALLVANQKRCKPPLPDSEVQKIARSIGRYEAAGPPSTRGCSREFLRVSEIVPRYVDFLWHPYIPKGKITMLEGDPGVGKSWLTQALAMGVSMGHGIPRRIEQAGNVLFLAGEDGPEDTVRPRLETMGADLERIYLVPEVFTLDHQGVQSLHWLIEQTKPELVVIDPLVAYMGSKLDLNAANETRSLMAPLAQMADQFNCALLCVRHLRKSGGKRIYQGLGSIDLVASARSVLHVSFDKEIPVMRVIRHTKCNVAQTGNKVFYHLREGMFFWGSDNLEGGSDE